MFHRRIILAAAAAITVLAVAACTDTSSVAESGAAGTAAASTGAAVSTPQPSDKLPDRAMLSMKYRNYLVSPDDTATYTAAVARADAVLTAQNQFPFAESVAPSYVSLVRYTAGLGNTPNASGKQVPNALNDRLSWVVLFDNVEVALSAPAGVPDAPTAEKTTLVVFIDAATGEFLRGGTLNDYAAGKA
jgi:hypothetical protein